MPDIIIIIIFLLIIQALIIAKLDFNTHFLNPIINYNKWSTINWFGIGTITVLLNILFLPYSILYWFGKLIYWLFTVGRK